jgi:hypothetical protein
MHLVILRYIRQSFPFDFCLRLNDPTIILLLLFSNCVHYNRMTGRQVEVEIGTLQAHLHSEEIQNLIQMFARNTMIICDFDFIIIVYSSDLHVIMRVFVT